jgi:hypothetical protein
MLKSRAVCYSAVLLRPNSRANDMADFIFLANIAHYKGLLAAETDAPKIAALRKLLAEEEAKLAEWRKKKSGPKASE